MFFDGTKDDEKLVGSFDALPPGDYMLVCTQIEPRLSRNTHGCEYFNMTFEVCQGPLTGRKVFKIAVYQHPTSQQAVSIGRGFMKALALATAKTAVIHQPEQCYRKPFWAEVKHKKDQNGEPQADINKVWPVGMNKPGAAPVQASTGQPWPPQGQQPQAQQQAQQWPPQQQQQRDQTVTREATSFPGQQAPQGQNQGQPFNPQANPNDVDMPF